MFRIPAPIQKKQTIFYPLHRAAPDSKKHLEIHLPSIEELPYANESHFQLLLNHLSIDDIVIIFTHMLFE